METPSNTTGALAALLNETEKGAAVKRSPGTQLFERNTVSAICIRVWLPARAIMLVERASQSAGIERDPWYVWTPLATV